MLPSIFRSISALALGPYFPAREKTAVPPFLTPPRVADISVPGSRRLLRDFFSSSRCRTRGLSLAWSNSLVTVLFFIHNIFKLIEELFYNLDVFIRDYQFKRDRIRIFHKKFFQGNIQFPADKNQVFQTYVSLLR
ncbi:hypothetical protein ES703_109346 [subsurface metagenome]